MPGFFYFYPESSAMFAGYYFEKTGKYMPLISERVNKTTSLMVVIPCFKEPDILDTLQSVFDCKPIHGIVEVFIIINEPDNCSPEISAYNNKTRWEVQEWVQAHPSEWLHFYPVGVIRLPSKWAGGGLARKTGMDEALYRFDMLNNPDGVIVSLDADTLVDNNYLQAISGHFVNYPEDVGVTIRFSHQTNGLPERQSEGIRRYEQYMHYYKASLTYAGYPYALYTVGSAFAVKAGAYLKRGGMTRRRAGEDFYFLQTLTQIGHIGEIDTTCVHPSARISDRCPFGTGMTMKNWMEGSDELLYTYNFKAFSDLKQFFSFKEQLYRIQNEEYEKLSQYWPDAIKAYISEENLLGEFRQLSSNCSRIEVFCDRFFQIFNAFRILKFLNFSHPRFYKKESLDLCVSELEVKVKPD
jgi:hypothetical protein